MDFGTILDKWDSMEKVSRKKDKTQNRTSHKKANARETSKTVESGKNIKRLQEAWLKKYGTVDKDAAAEKAQKSEIEKTHEQIKKIPVDAQIDLHGLTSEEAFTRLENFTTFCVQKGMRKILIIHGKGIHSENGDAVLKNVVQKFIQTNVHCGVSGHPNRTLGGTGATWCMLK